MKKPLGKIATAVQASTTLAIDALYKQMKAQGADVVGFGAGEPDFNTPDNIKSAGIKAINDNITRYTPAAGLEALKKAVCDKLLGDCGVRYEPSQILISSGAKHNLFIALMCLCDPGDEVIIPAPYWVSYLEQVGMAGAKPVIVEAFEDQNFKITAAQLEAAITDRTKAVFINSPNNPTGMMYSRAELEELAKVCVRHGIYVIADDIYYKLVYDNKEFCSIASLGDDIKALTVLINGVSKSYAMTGWRIGYTAAPPELAKVFANYQSHSTSAPCSISQMASIEALCGEQESIEAMRKVFEERRDYFVSRVEEIDGVSCLRPDGAFYIMMNIEKLVGRTLHGTEIKNADDFGKVFLEKGNVAVVPCTGFGAPNHVRWSYAVSMDDIKKGLDRLEAFLKS